MIELNAITESRDDRRSCRGCQWWQAEFDEPAVATIGLCMQPELTHFSLEVSGHSGCNRFLAGIPVESGSAASG